MLKDDFILTYVLRYKKFRREPEMDFIPRIYRPIINQSQLCTGFTMTELTNYDSD